MPRREPECDEHARDKAACLEAEAGAEDSIEILEVVGMDPDDSASSSAEAGAAEPMDPPAESIPYSQRELYDMLVRKQAEFENAKKRLEREKLESRDRLSMELIRLFLPILDNFHRALEEGSAPSEDSFRRGVALTVQHMLELLRREGLEEIEAKGHPFDPHLHEAVETREVEGVEEGIILEDLRRGYRYRGHLLRPTLVRVSARGPSHSKRGA